MPNVSDEYIEHSRKLAEGVKHLLNKSAATTANVKSVLPHAELVAETMVQQGLIPAAQKQAAVASLQDHEQALLALNKLAQLKGEAIKKQAEMVPSMGTAVSVAPKFDANGEQIRKSDMVLYQRLGFPV